MKTNIISESRTIVMDTNKERIYAYGYSEDNFSNADVESEMQDYADEQEPDTWEVQTAEYWSEDDCWSARLLCINY